MAKRRRKRKKKITYDSKETSTFLGLLGIIGSIFFLIAALTDTEGEDTLFAQASGLFGNTTIFFSLFLLSVGVYMLGMRTKRITRITLLFQGILVLLLAALATAFDTSPPQEIANTGSRTNGGEIGFSIIRNIFGDLTPALASTKFILVLLTLVVVPIALSLSLHEVFTYVKKALAFIINWFKVLFTYQDEKNDAKSKKEKEETKEKASRFGDFSSFLTGGDKDNQEDTKSKRDKKESESLPKTTSQKSGSESLAAKKQAAVQKQLENDDAVDVKEGALGDDGLKQESLHFPDWKLPPLSLLSPFKAAKPKDAQTKQKADIIEQILESFNIEAKVEDAYIGPSVIQYALNIPLGIKISKVAALGENIALALGVDSKAVRVETIPGTPYLGIEVPRSQRDMVRIKELMSSESMKTNKRHLKVVFGKDIHGDAVTAGIEKMPHLLIAGATGSGKSILTNTIITSLIMHKTPDELKLILVDPKQVELIDYNGIPHLLTPVITDMDQVVNALKWAVGEMERRYTHLASETVRNIEQFNEKKGFAAMPYIVIVIDEMADMMMTASKVDAENAIVRIAQKARAVGIHLILATQRPSVNVITGIIKANIPGRIGMSVTSSTDSRVILDAVGAESLMGGGDMLYKAPDKTKSQRLQGGFIEQEEVIRVVDFIKAQAPEVEYITEITEKQLSEEEATMEVLGDISEDNLVEQAIRLVVRAQKGSSSYLQRRLSIGFNRAARLLDELEEAGVVGPPNGSKPREVLITDADSFIAQLQAQGDNS